MLIIPLKTRAAFNSAPWSHLRENPHIVSKMAAPITSMHLQLNEELWLAEAFSSKMATPTVDGLQLKTALIGWHWCHFGGALGRFCLSEKCDIWEPTPRQRLKVYWPKKCRGDIMESTLRHSFNTAQISLYKCMYVCRLLWHDTYTLTDLVMVRYWAVVDKCGCLNPNHLCWTSKQQRPNAFQIRQY